MILLSIFFFGIGNNLNAQTVTGPTLVCTTAQYSINVGCTPTWTCSSNLNLTSGQGTTTATFSVNGSGYGWVKATWCSIYSHTLQVFIGPPDPPTYVTNEAYYWGIAGTWMSAFTVYHTVPALQQPFSNIYSADDSYYYGQNYWHLYFEYAGLYQIWATNSNACGESNAVYMYYLGPEDGIEFGYSVYDE